MISQSILHQIRVRQNLDLEVSLEQPLSMKLLRCLESHAKIWTQLTSLVAGSWLGFRFQLIGIVMIADI